MKRRMLSYSRNYLTLCAVGLFIGVTLGGVLRPSNAHAPSDTRPGNARQEGEKVIKKSSFRNEPVKIIKVKNKKGELTLGRKFQADDAEWLHGFTITVRNDSGKTITHMEFTLFFPREVDNATGQGSYASYLMYGVSPSDEHYEESRKRRPDRVVKKGEEYDLTLSDEQLNHINKALTLLEYPPNIRKMDFWINQVGFDDGSAWKGGRYFDRGDHSQRIKQLPRNNILRDSFFVKASLPGTKPHSPIRMRGRNAPVLDKRLFYSRMPVAE